MNYIYYNVIEYKEKLSNQAFDGISIIDWMNDGFQLKLCLYC